MYAGYLEYQPTGRSQPRAQVVRASDGENLAQRLLGMQQNITLYGESYAELVKALRIHPRFEDWRVKDLLTYVRGQADSNFQLTTKLSLRLIPTFAAVLAAEGIRVHVE